MEQMLLTYGFPKETATTIMMLYKNRKAMVLSPDGDTIIVSGVSGVQPEDTLSPRLFITYLDFVTSIDLIKENGFTLKKGRKQTIS